MSSPRMTFNLTCGKGVTELQNLASLRLSSFAESRQMQQKNFDISPYYFDSYGIPPINLRHLRFCRNSSQGFWTFNRQQLQNLTSSNCGYHCLRFMIETCRTLNPVTALSAMRSAPTNLTDKTAVTYMLMNERKWRRRGVYAGTTNTGMYTSRRPIHQSRRMLDSTDSSEDDYTIDLPK